MSYLDSQPLESEGIEKFVDQKRWNNFIQMVLEVTIRAFQKLSEKSIATLQWEEDHFTINLEDCLRPLSSAIGLTVVSQIPVYTPEMKAGKVSVKNAKVLDLRMWGKWEAYDKIHFIWECKLIAPSSEKQYKRLVYDYVIKGMVRFLHEEWKYANFVDDSGMLGYVLTGEVPSIVDDINQKMLVPPRPRKSSKSIAQAKQPSLSSSNFSVSDFLKLSSPIGAFPHIYQSCHDRAFCNRPIHLYHLFLIFDFNNQNGL